MLLNEQQHQVMIERAKQVAARKQAEQVADEMFGATNGEDTDGVWDELTEAVPEPELEDAVIVLDRDIHEPMSVGQHRVRTQFRGMGQGPKGAYVRLRFECTEDGPERGYEATDNLSLSKAARFKLDAFLDAVGAPRTGEVKASSFDGKELTVIVEADTYNDQVRAKVAAYVPAGRETEANKLPGEFS